MARYKELSKSYLQRETVWREIHRMFREYQDLSEKLATARANLERLQQTSVPTVRQVIREELAKVSE
jgi:DNA-binding Xre family transcriptional regulator